MEPGRRIQPFRNAQMLNLRSLAAILYSAIRFSRAAFLRSPLRSKALINAQKMAKNMAPNMATNRAPSMSVSYKQSTPKTRTGKIRRCPAQKHNQRTNRTLPAKDDSWRNIPITLKTPGRGRSRLDDECAKLCRFGCCRRYPNVTERNG